NSSLLLDLVKHFIFFQFPDPSTNRAIICKILTSSVKLMDKWDGMQEEGHLPLVTATELYKDAERLGYGLGAFDT
ncbi:MAG: hypothetical protein ACE5HY_06370, partial [Candidatus Hydrothermarchaeales archaeon]